MTDGNQHLCRSGHAAALEPQRLALQAIRALQDPDPTVLDAFLARLRADVAAAGDADGEFFEDFDASLAQYAVMFGRRAHGAGLDGELARLQAALDGHVAGYEP